MDAGGIHLAQMAQVVQPVAGPPARMLQIKPRTITSESMSSLKRWPRKKEVKARATEGFRFCMVPNLPL